MHVSRSIQAADMLISYSLLFQEKSLLAKRTGKRKIQANKRQKLAFFSGGMSLTVL
jgi:hypothetical protein